MTTREERQERAVELLAKEALADVLVRLERLPLESQFWVLRSASTLIQVTTEDTKPGKVS